MLVQLDNTNTQISLPIEQATLSAYQMMTASALPLVRLSPSIASSTVSLLPPVYGSLDPVYRDNVAPGIIILVPYLQAIALVCHEWRLRNISSF